MSNTRNLADLLDSSGDIKSAALDNVTPTTSASDLTSGTLAGARIADDTITTAKVADGQITAAKVAADVATQAEIDAKLNLSGGTLTGTLTMESTDAGSAAAPELILYRNSASPADADYLGQIQFKGENDNGGSEIYAKVTGKITDASNGTEDGLIETAIKGNGSFTIVSRQKSNELQLLNGVNLDVDGSVTATGYTGSGANLTSLPSAQLTGALPAIDGSNLTGVATDTSTIENNIAMLAFYRATDHSKNKYNLVDQVIDDFNDNSGVDASASTNEALTSGYYQGQVSSTANATGGTITTSGSYTYHEFPHTGGGNSQTTATFTAPGTGTIDYLIVGGGGSGRSTHVGNISGGQGGSLQLFTGQSKTAGNYTIVTGSGGTGWTSANDGQSSSAFGTTKSGGSNGGTTGAGHAGTTVSQFSQFGVSGVFGGGGGGTCQNGGSGGGARGGCAAGDNPPDGVHGTGGGGGAGNNHANASSDTAGHGIVLIRYLTNGFTSSTAGNLTLQSTANTASSAPSTGDLVVLTENAEGTATINTDVKGYVSRDGGSNWTQGTLIDEGSWGTNKKILAFHNLDISSQPSGTSLKYKITTHNQSAGSKETRIHATSLAWA